METTFDVGRGKHFAESRIFLYMEASVAAFKAYYAIRSFITYNGIFMGPDMTLGMGAFGGGVGGVGER